MGFLRLALQIVSLFTIFSASSAVSSVACSARSEVVWATVTQGCGLRPYPGLYYLSPSGTENGTRNLSYGDGERNADALVRRFRHLLNVIRRGWGSRPVRAPHSVRTGSSAFLGINHQQTVKDQTIPFKHSQTPHRFEAHSAQNARFARNAQKTGTGAVAVGLRVRSPHVSKGVMKEK